MKRAFQCQLKGLGFSYVEILAPCVTGLRRSPVDAMAWVRDELENYYMVGELKKPKEA